MTLAASDPELLHRSLDPLWYQVDDLEIWGTDVTTAEPYILCGLAAALHWFCLRGLEVTFRGPQNARHLEEMGFYDVLPECVKVEGREKARSGTTWKAVLPIRHIRDSSTIDQTTEEFLENAKDRAAGRWLGGVSQSIAAECLAEALVNAMEHSQSQVGFFAGAWAYDRDGPLSIAVVDLGVGIPDHLRRRDVYSGLNDQLALRRCVEDRVSGLPDPHRGAGLHYLLAAARRAGGGRLAIRAGEAELQARLQRKSDRRTTTTVAGLPGTWIRLNIKRN